MWPSYSLKSHPGVFSSIKEEEKKEKALLISPKALTVNTGICMSLKQQTINTHTKKNTIKSQISNIGLYIRFNISVQTIR